MAYQLLIAKGVVDFIEERVTGRRVYERIVEAERLVAEYPEMAPQYDPDYPAARPPFPCRRLVVPSTPFVLYYATDDDARTVTVFYMEFAAADPRKRF